MKRNDWLKKKYYTHFSIKLIEEKQIKNVRSIVKNPDYIAKHSFFPLIHKTFKERKYKKISNDVDKFFRAHKYCDKNGNVISSEKEREIFYSNHLDSHIYSYYAKIILGKLYEDKVQQCERDFSDCICAYRRITKQNSQKGKSNINFANEVFTEISKFNDCAVLLFDIKSFFDSLDHKLLKKSWCSLLNVKSLPKDHYNIYKSVTKFKYVELKDIYKVLGIKSEKVLKRKNYASFFKDGNEFRNKIANKGYIKSNPFTDSQGNSRGIPQGTPISAFLANLYLMDFDITIHQLLHGKEFGIYRRYSDDIMIVCPSNDIIEIKAFVLNEITKYGLEIQAAKTEKFLCKKGKNNAIDTYIVDDNGQPISANARIRYLGFEYDGNKVSIKGSSLSKFYRELKSDIKAKYHWAKKGVLNERKKGIQFSKIHRSKLYRRFAHFSNSIKKRNYYNYGRDAQNEMQDHHNVIIKRQLRNHFKILSKLIKQYEIKLNDKGNLRHKNYLRNLIQNKVKPK